MAGLRLYTLVIAVTAVTSAWQSAPAQDIEFAGHTEILSRIQRLEGELASLRTAKSQHAASHVGYDVGAPHSFPSHSLPSSGCQNSCCQTNCCDGYCNVENGWYAAAEAVIVKPFFENGVQRPGDNGAFDSHASPRFVLGYRNDAGFGIRGRYWWLDTVSEFPPNSRETSELHFQVADLEGTRSVCWGTMTADFFIGARWARIQYEDDGGATTSQGIGPSIGADTRIPLGESGLSAVGNVRGSALFGSADGNGALSNKTMYAGEVQMGIQYSRCVGNGVVSLYALCEAQAWMAATASPGSIGGDAPDEDLGLLGITLGGQIRY